MNKIKIILPLIVLLGLNGCISSSSSYYVLSMASHPSVVYTKKNSIIGVTKITVPGYLYKREIAVAKTSSQITLLGNAVWGEDLDAGLTQRLITFLQNKFNQPSVYEYPWGVDRQPTVKINVAITRFIAQGDRVYLDANWDVVHIKTHKRKARLFNTSVPTSSEVSNIVEAMNRAFAQLEEQVALDVKHFKLAL
jgi:cholesterol transport system auxiliary component